MAEDTSIAEEWRTIPAHPDYEASSLGRIRSLKRRTPQVMSPYLHKLGYRRLTVDGRQTGVHQLVAAAFHGPCPAGMEVDHINDVRDDNRPENLQYLTRQQNLLLRNLRRLGDVCGKGHDLVGDNLYIRPKSGRRECKTCSADRLQKIKNQPVDFSTMTHGNTATYSRGCRCDECRAASRKYRRDLAQSRRAA